MEPKKAIEILRYEIDRLPLHSPKREGYNRDIKTLRNADLVTQARGLNRRIEPDRLELNDFLMFASYGALAACCLSAFVLVMTYLFQAYP
jgi:hypothetical protein